MPSIYDDMQSANRATRLSLPLRCFLMLFVAAACGCAGGASSFSAGANLAPVVSSIASTRGGAALRPGANGARIPAPQTLCVGGTQYATVNDDEFSQDKTLNYSPSMIGATPQPNGATWSSRAEFFSSDNSRNNVGTDDAYYTDPTRGLGPYSPYYLAGGVLQIKAVPVPSPYATAPQLEGAHWLSGLLESMTNTYGYIEISAKVPTEQGSWPAGLWLLGSAGDDGKGNGYEELDVNELFGTALPPATVQQTQTFSASGNPPSNYVRTVAAPDPTTHFHTYGVLWTPSIVRFYIDRKPTSPDYVNAANGPAHAIINLGVFTKNTWSPPPPNDSPITMNMQYFRWYQSTPQSCSPSILPT